MCTFFVKKPNQTIKREHFETIIENNPQGFGFMYTTGKKIVIVKSSAPDSLDMWHKYVDAVKRYPKSHFIGHGRIATGSNINDANTHPFAVNQSLAMVHNGIIRQYPSTKSESDTMQYIKNVLRKLPKDFYKNGAIMDLIGNDIVGSKFAFLTIDNRVYIVNKYLCTIDKETGVLFSNQNYLPSLWLDYGGNKVKKQTYTSKSIQLPLLDTKGGDAKDFSYCQDCEEWYKNDEFSKEDKMCIHCVSEFKSWNKSFSCNTSVKGKCDECQTSDAIGSWYDFKLCSECYKNYESYFPDFVI